MIRDGRDIANGTVISTQVCIIGSGPAGITAAWHLQKAGLKVTLIEGSRDYRAAGDNFQASWPDSPWAPGERPHALACTRLRISTSGVTGA